MIKRGEKPNKADILLWGDLPADVRRKNPTKVEKSTPLPPEYKQVADTLDIPVYTYGDLAFAKMALEADPDSESRAPYKILFNSLNVLGFNLSILERLK